MPPSRSLRIRPLLTALQIALGLMLLALGASPVSPILGKRASAPPRPTNAAKPSR